MADTSTKKYSQSIKGQITRITDASDLLAKKVALMTLKVPATTDNIPTTVESTTTAENLPAVADTTVIEDVAAALNSVPIWNSINRTPAHGVAETIYAGYYPTNFTVKSKGTLDSGQSDVQASYILTGYQAWNSNGDPITGTMPNYTSARVGNSTTWDATNSRVGIKINSTGRYTTNASVYLPASDFGTATTAQVLKGKTFTSTAGVKVEGTMTDHNGAVAGGSAAWDKDNSRISIAITDANKGYYDSSDKVYTNASNFGDVAASNVLTGYTFTSSSGLKVDGTMLNKTGNQSAGGIGSYENSTDKKSYLYLSIPATGKYSSGSELRSTIPYNSIGITSNGVTSWNPEIEITKTTNKETEESSLTINSIKIPAGYYTNDITVKPVLSYSDAGNKIINTTTYTATGAVTNATPETGYDYFTSVSVRAAATPALTVLASDENLSIGTESNGKYPISATVTAKTTYTTSGWIGTGGLGNVEASSTRIGYIPALAEGSTGTKNTSGSNGTVGTSVGTIGSYTKYTNTSGASATKVSFKVGTSGYYTANELIYSDYNYYTYANGATSGTQTVDASAGANNSNNTSKTITIPAGYYANQTVITVQGSVNAGSHSIDGTNAPAFSTSSTYAVGDYVFYNSKLYKCKTAITTAGAWSSTKWDVLSFTEINNQYVIDTKTSGYISGSTEYYKIRTGSINAVTASEPTDTENTVTFGGGTVATAGWVETATGKPSTITLTQSTVSNIAPSGTLLATVTPNNSDQYISAASWTMGGIKINKVSAGKGVITSDFGTKAGILDIALVDGVASKNYGPTTDLDSGSPTYFSSVDINVTGIIKLLQAI